MYLKNAECCCVVNFYSAGVVTHDRRIGSRSPCTRLAELFGPFGFTYVYLVMYVVVL
jgi:hypothetical protein